MPHQGSDPSVRSRAAVAGLALCMLLSSLGISLAAVGLPSLAQAWSAPLRQVQWVLLAYLVASTALVVHVGRLGDLAGRRRLLLAGLGLYTLGALIGGLAPSLGLLVAARALQGLGAAAMAALATALVGEAVPKAQAGRAMGLLGTASAVGTAAGPTLGGALVAGFGWRALFLLLVPLGAIAAGLVASGLPGGRRPMAPNRAEPLHRVLRGALREPALAGGLAMSALVATVVMATLVVGPFHLSQALGLDAASVGLAMSAGPLVTALGGVPAGHLADRFGAARMVTAGLAAMAAGCGLLAVLPAALGVAGYVLPLVVLTAGYALFQAANNTAVMAGAAADRRGVLAGVLNLSRQLGLIAGASAMGAVYAWAGLHAAFAAAAGLMGLALWIARAGAVQRGRREVLR